MIGPDVPTTVVVDDRSALEVGASAVAVPVWPGEGDAGPWVGEGAADLHALGVDLFGALERDKASGRAGQVVSGPGRRRRARGRQGRHGLRHPGAALLARERSAG
ncbi:MAG: hypothetical protein ACRDVO_15745 [Jiangellaceae bacterium]